MLLNAIMEGTSARLVWAIKKIRKEIPVVAQTAFEAYFNEDEIHQAGCS